MVVDPAVMEAQTTTETVEPAGSTDALALMREGLKETTPEDTGGDATEATAEGSEAGETASSEVPKSAPSRRAKTVEREVGKVKTEVATVLTEAEQKIKDAEDRANAAEARAAELEARASQPEAEQQQQRQAQLAAEYGEWIGTPDQYAEAERLSVMDPDAPDWDFDKHKDAVTKLTTWKDRRKWAGILAPNAEAVGEARAFEKISRDFVETLAADLPEDKREAYTTHKDGIPGAVRFYAETVYAPKIEALEATIAERDAEIERLRTAGGGSYRSPAPGGPAAPPTGLDYNRLTPEELMAAELREQARQSRSRR